jgi:ADP-ribose pyrophosphatase YjhB (NUDIX family)
MKEKRVKADLVVAGFLKNQRGEVLLVERNDDWTLPTGHMDISRDSNLKETVNREMKEELSGLKRLIIVESLDTFVRHSELVRNKGSSLKSKSIAIYSCNVYDSEIEYFNEGGTRKKKIWIRPSQALGLDNLDDLAKFAINMFLKRYSGKKENGGNGNVKVNPNKDSIK